MVIVLGSRTGAYLQTEDILGNTSSILYIKPLCCMYTGNMYNYLLSV